MSAQSRSTTDPATDDAAADVIAAFDAAQRTGSALVECYRAGIEAWRRAHPDHAFQYAAQQAVTVILAAKISLHVDA